MIQLLDQASSEENIMMQTSRVSSSKKENDEFQNIVTCAIDYETSNTSKNDYENAGTTIDQKFMPKSSDS